MSDLAEVREALEGFQKLLQSLRFPDQQAARAIAALSRMEVGEVVLAKRPVAFRVKDFADGWIIFQDEERTLREVEETGALMQGLYIRAGDAAPPPPQPEMSDPSTSSGQALAEVRAALEKAHATAIALGHADSAVGYFNALAALSRITPPNKGARS